MVAIEFFFKDASLKLYAAKEASIMAEFSAADQRNPVVSVPPFALPVSADLISYQKAFLDSNKVRLSNLKDKFLQTRSFLCKRPVPMMYIQ